METDNLLNFSVSIEDASSNSTTATTNAVLIKQDEKVVFPITHTSALIGPISDKAYNIDNDVYNNDLDLVTTNGLYYGGPYSNAKYEFLYQSYFLVQVIRYDRCSIQIILSTASHGVGLLSSNYAGNLVAYRSGYQDSDSLRFYWNDWKQYTPTIPTASATTIGGIKVGENLTISADGTLSAQATGGTSDYTALENKPILNTDNTESQTTNNNETINGTINLHKVSKTGSYDDLNNKLNLVNGEGTNAIKSINASSASGSTAFAEGINTKASGDYSHAEGNNTTASYEAAHAEGYMSTASDKYSHAEGYSTRAQSMGSHAEGNNTTASGNYSHSEGFNTEASGNYSHSEGNSTIASGENSHAEGNNTTASGAAAHAEGSNTVSSGNVSHAEGLSTVSAGVFQHVQGRYNIQDTENKYAHIVGNGDESTETRSNAHTIDWEGNSWYAGAVIVGGTSDTSANGRMKYNADTESIDFIFN